MAIALNSNKALSFQQKFPKKKNQPESISFQIPSYF